MVMESVPGPGNSPASSGRNPTVAAAPPAQLNPHNLGREFVRQYYTLLNRAPNALHRLVYDIFVIKEVNMMT